MPAGKNHHNWKGDNVSYRGIHYWIVRQKGKPKECECCWTTIGRIHWCNIDHKYKRDSSDYIAMCVKCHSRFDKFYNDYYNEEHRKKLSLAHKGKKLSKEHRAKMSESQRNRYKIKTLIT